MPTKVVTDLRLAVLHAEISRKVRVRKDYPNVPLYGEVNIREYAYILNELIVRRGTIRKTNRSPITNALIGMKVGDSIIVPEMAQSTLTTLRKTARKVLGIDDARWHGEATLSGKMKITRMADGSPHLFGKAKSPAVSILANMRIGEIVTILLPGSFHNGIKVNARKQRGDPTMKWRATALVNGKHRVERTA